MHVTAASPDVGVIVAAVRAVPGVSDAHVDSSGELIVELHTHAHPTAVSRAVRTLLRAGLGWRAQDSVGVTTPVDPPDAPGAPLAQVIPLPRRSWPGAVPGAPDLDVVVALDQAIARHPAGHARDLPVPAVLSGWEQPGDLPATDANVVQVRTRGQRDPAGQLRVEIALTLRWHGRLTEVRQHVDATAAAVRVGLADAAVAAAGRAQVDVLDVQTLDLAGRDAVAVVVQHADEMGMGVAWVEADSRVACVVATLDALTRLAHD